MPEIPKGYKHVFYMLPLRLDENKIRINKRKIYNYLIKQKIPVGMTYVDLSEFKILNQLRDYNKYNKDSLEHVKKANSISYLGIQMWKYDFSKKELIYIIDTFKKAWKKFQI